VISNDVYKILEYVLNARMVSMEINVFVLISVRLMVSILKGVVLPVLMDILEIVVLFIVQSVYTRNGLCNACKVVWQEDTIVMAGFFLMNELLSYDRNGTSMCDNYMVGWHKPLQYNFHLSTASQKQLQLIVLLENV
jgi:hypothetical protein